MLDSFKVTDLCIYPIKSCAGFSVNEMPIGECGPLWDRHWVLADEQGKKITQRDSPQLSLVKVTPIDYLKGVFELSFPEAQTIQLVVNPIESDNKMNVEVWGNQLTGLNTEQAVSDWFSKIIGQKVYLLENNSSVTNRFVSKKYGEARLGFADGFPLLLLGSASVDFLNDQLASPVSFLRFRPNIIVKTTEPHCEDEWTHFSINNVKFKGVKHCSRCVMVNIDPKTGVASNTVLKALMKYRRTDKGVIFGENLLHLNEGSIKLNDALTF